MLRIITVLEKTFKKLTEQDWDNVLIIGGDEGIGKSTLLLQIFDWWYIKLQEHGIIKKLDPDYLIKFIALSMSQFLYGLKDMKQFYLMAYDEGGELSSLRMMNKFNYAVTKTYEVVRGENLFSIIVVPDVFYINPFFSTRRARGYIHVYKRGSFAYWNKTRLRDMIEVNKTFKRKSPWRVPPLFYDTFSKYNGPMLPNYKAKKKEKMEIIREELYNKVIVKEEAAFNFLKYIYNASELRGQKLTKKTIADIFEISERTVYNKIEEYKQVQKKEGLVEQ